MSDRLGPDKATCGEDCESREVCTRCTDTLCPEHDVTVVTACGEGPHHDEEAGECRSCSDIALEDALVDRADAIRKGEW